MLPSISKIIERVIHDQPNAFLSDEDILYNYQSGFRSDHSTSICLSFLTDKVLKRFDEGLSTGMILIDLQKAFDTIVGLLRVEIPCISAKKYDAFLRITTYSIELSIE